MRKIRLDIDLILYSIMHSLFCVYAENFKKKGYTQFIFPKFKCLKFFKGANEMNGKSQMITQSTILAIGLDKNND